MKAILDARIGEKPIIRLEAENVDEERIFLLMWKQNVQLVSYNGYNKLTITCGSVSSVDSHGESGG